MNPNQPSGTPGQDGTVTPPGTPPPANSGPVNDIPEDGFGFSDARTSLPPVVRPAAPLQPQPITPRPAPQLVAPPRPVVPQTAPFQATPIATPAPRPVAPPIAPAAQPAPIAVPPALGLPTQATPVVIPTPTPPPTTVMPPQRVPTIPTLAQPAPAAAPTTVAAPAPQPSARGPQPTAYAAAPAPVAATPPFDPAKVPVTATSTPVNPITASYSPQPVTHLSEDITNRIGEKPMQNSGDILRQIKHGLDGHRVKSILSFIVFVVSIFAAAFLINQFVFQSYYVEGTSMTPTLQNNDRLIISKVERTLAGVQGKPYIPERGQIVVLDSSIMGLNGQHEQLIKRVIGLPGDRLHIEAGTVVITNQQHPDGYDVTKDLGLTNLQATYTEEPLDLVVPQDRVFVMGDNREQGGSYDSRAFGPIEGNQIQGRLWGRVLPLEKAQLY